MLTNRFIHLLLLVSMSLWCSGVTRAMHEWIEHAPTVSPSVERASADALSHAGIDRTSPLISASPIDDHDGCITCQLLAASVIAAWFVITMLLAGDVAKTLGRFRLQLPRLAPFFPALPSCGPPATV